MLIEHVLVFRTLPPHPRFYFVTFDKVCFVSPSLELGSLAPAKKKSTMYPGLVLLYLLIASCFTLVVGPGASAPTTWTGTQAQNALATPINSPSIYATAGLSVNALVNAATDAVLLVVNINVASNAASYQMAFTIVRGSFDLSTTFHVMAEIGPTVSSTESIPMTFSFLDYPGVAGSTTYMVNAMYTATLSLNGQMSQIGALVIPNSMATNRATVYTEVSYPSNGLQPVSGLSSAIVPPSSSHVVLVSVTFSVYPSSVNTVIDFSLLRNTARIDTISMQRISLPSGARQCTIFYLDGPSSTSSVTYSVSATVNQGLGFTVCKASKDIAHMNLLAVPGNTVASVISETAKTISGSAWMTMGLLVTVTPASASDTVLVTVNLNVCPTVAATATGVFTIFGNGVNLGSGTYGLQTVTVSADGLYTPVTMSFLDTPNVAGASVTYIVYAMVIGSGLIVVSANGQLRQIAAIVSNAAPPAPTLNPTLNPTTTPTVAPAVIGQSKFVQTVIVTPLFVMSMAITLPSTAVFGEVANIWDIKDGFTGDSLIALYRTATLDTCLYYNQVPLGTATTILATSLGTSPTAATVFTITMRDSSIRLDSSNGFTGIYNITKANAGSVSGNLFASNSGDTSSGGTFAAFSFRCKYY